MKAPQRGFTLIELLVSSAVVLLVVGAIAALAGPMRRAFDRGLGGSEVVSRGRTALAAVIADARDAGSGVVIGPADVTLGDLIPVVVPLRSLDDPRPVPPYSAVAMTRAAAAQGLLRDRIDAGTVWLTLDGGGPCLEQAATCGLRPGDPAVIFDSTRLAWFVVTSVDGGAARLLVSSPLPAPFDSGAVIAALEHTTYGLRTGRDGSARLVRVTAGGAEQPIADRVVAFDVMADRRRLDVRLRLDPLLPGGSGIELRGSVALRQ